MYTYDILKNNKVKIRPITMADYEENYFDKLEILTKQLNDEGYTIVSDIQYAKDILKNEGYFVDNLWHISDVQQIYDCTDEKAQEVLFNALTCEWVGQEVFSSIDIQFNNLKIN
jgi:hypothetical protein